MSGKSGSQLRIAGITKHYGNAPVLDNIDLTVSGGEIVCLLGSSGSGKTTLLRLIAGLETPEQGEILLDGRSILTTPVHVRRLGLMFQDHALFPHMTVARNIAFGLKMRGASKSEQDRRVTELLELVDLRGYERRDVATLSGGEKQRVALARSLAPDPPLLMLDEPLGALDAALRERLVVDLRLIIKRVGLTAIYVTHDRQEAFAVADRIAVLNSGQIEQIDTPQAIYQQPLTAYVARFLGLGNIFPVKSAHNGVAVTDVGEFSVVGTPSTILIHPDGIRLAGADDEGLHGKIEAMRYEGSRYHLEVALDDGARLTFDQPIFGAGSLQVGNAVSIIFERSAVVTLNGSYR